MSFQSSTDREGERRRNNAESLYQHGRMALKHGERARAQQLLLQAVDYDRNHSEAWLWLSATTDDPGEQKKYLEWAIAANPGNAAAKRGLGLLTGKINPADVVKPGEGVAPRQPEEPEIVSTRREFKCPKCGGELRFDPELVDLKCEHCGYVEVVEEVSAVGREQVLDFSLAVKQGHRWAEAERRFTCGQCHATTVLAVGQTSAECPFCGVAALVAAPEERELLPLQGLIPMGFELEEAVRHFRHWLGRGLFDPDDLKHLALRTPFPAPSGPGVSRTGLHPAYVPFWTFSATLIAHWRAQVSEGYGKQQRWAWRTGERTFFYTDRLVAGLKALPAKLVQRIQDYDLSKLIIYKPEYLAQWPAALYDVSLADASLVSREMMVEDAKRQLETQAVVNKQVIHLTVNSSDFTGQTYKLVLLPMWIGAYRYKDQIYRVLINGQTGEVAGDKPRDSVKVALVAIIGLVVLIMLGVLGFLLVRPLLAGF
jgi:DNA-directed RNA polymerase subunit RPC12/RpoP